jgi:hypothetical protein
MYLHIADKINDNNTTLMFIGLHKTTQVSNIKATTKIQNLTIARIINIYYTLQKTWMPQEENSVGKDKELCSQTNVLYCERQKCNSNEIF